MQNKMLDFCGSPFWNSNLTWHTQNPFLSPCIELTILIWIPCILLFVFAPLDIYYSKSSKYPNIPWGFINITRLVIPTLLICLSIVELTMALLFRDEFNLHDVHMVSPLIKLSSFLLAMILAYLHKINGIVSSGLAFLFWFILWLFAIPQYRTEIVQFQSRESPIGSEIISWNDYQFFNYMLYFPLITSQLLVNCLSDNKALHSNYGGKHKQSPETRASFLRKLFFSWFNYFAWIGYRKPLTIDDMWNIREGDTSKELEYVFEKHWTESVEKGRRKESTGSESTNGSILPAMFKAFGAQFFFAGILKLVLDLLAFASPQLLSLLINFTLDKNSPLWHGIVFAVGLFLVSVVSSLINGQFLYKSFFVGFRIRSALISSIYRKALTISNSAKKDTTIGEIVNLMIIDAQRFFELIQYLHILWAGPLTTALSIYFLYNILGVAAFSGLAVMLLMLPLNAFFANSLRNYQIDQMKWKDERVKFMNEILSGIKALKLYAWEISFQEYVQNIRNKELHVIKKIAVMNGLIFFMWTIVPFFVTLASFATYVLLYDNNVFDANVAFVSLSFFNILRQPLTMFPMVISYVMQAKVSVDRINKFLNSEDLDIKSITHNSDDSHAIKITDGVFSWGNEIIVLRNINLFVSPGDIVAVVGKVGSGKSSLISSILGEMKVIRGSINTHGSLAYVAQQAWIQNATLRDNILFGKPFDKNLYFQILEACALNTDINMLPGGDRTEIGEKGINLSGGQKQRVALARAVYSQADIYLLDDAMSAVDSHVGKHIFEHVIGPNGILANKTRIFVTHNISYLPPLDNIYVMNGGEISESGHYEKLIAQMGAFADFISEHLQQYDEDDEELAEIKEILSASTEGSILLERDYFSSESDINTSGRSSIRSQRSQHRKISFDVSRAMLIGKEESATGSVGFGVYIRYWKSIGFRFGALIIVGCVANQAFSVYSSMWLSDWAANPDNSTPELRNMYLVVYSGLGLVQSIALLAMSLAVGIGCVVAARDLHTKLLTRTMRLPMSFFDSTPLGRIINRFSKDVDIVDNGIPQIVRLWILMLFNAIAILVVISISTPVFIGVIIPILILYYFIQRYYVRTSRQLRRIESVTRSPIYSHFTETINGRSTIRAFGVQSRFIADSESHVDLNQRCSYPSIVAVRWLGVRLEIVSGLVIFFSALFAVLGRETMRGGAIVGLSVSYALQITSVLNYLVRMTAELETSIVANERMDEYSNIKTEAVCTRKPDPSWPSVGHIVFENYKVRYRENLDLVLRGCSFEVMGGEKIGIVGRTGAGKSSLTLGLFRIIEAAGGRITIDGLDISKMDLQSLRSRLTIIPQDPVLFSGTMRMNIDPFGSYTDDEVWLALDHAHLKAFIKSQDMALQFEVSEGGENLSVGQRQLVCLARALLRKTKVLILDEATAGVDLETDTLIQKTIRTQFQDCTILTIAHRLITIMDSDKLLVLERGNVAEFDSPSSLLENKNSIFYGMAVDAGLVTNK